ncbi:MAG: hypothetical protein RI924_1048 [Bacteroidota bacterium]|jgi:pimeloyl-ACP methyl ester carboxylesterase
MMRKHILTVIFLSSIGMLILSCRSKNKTTIKKSDSYLVNDFEQDKDFPAGMEELQIPSDGVTIYGLIYLANGPGPHPTLVFIHGNPGNERNLDLAQNLRKVGYNVVYFDFRGSWGSKGKFTFENNIADTKAVIEYISSPDNIRRLRIDSAKIALFGHNTGGAIGLIAGLKHPKVKGVATLSLFNPYRVIKNAEGTSNLISMKEYLSTLGMLNINPDEFLLAMAKNVEQYNLEALLKQTNKPILMIDEHEANDYLSALEVKENIEYEIWDTDITFSNKRTALTRRIKSWADQKINPVAVSIKK